MEKSFGFNSINGDRRYKAEDFREYFASFIENGIFPNPNSNLQVISNSNMTVTVKAGKAWIDGGYYNNTSDLILNIDYADGILNRIDRLVVRLDTATRDMKVNVKKGVFASNPIAPELQRDADAYELCIATIRINAGTTSISQNFITDTRLNSDVCGMVNSLIKVDSTILTDKLEQDFYDWLETIQGVLDGDIAGNLANEINKINQRLDTLKLDAANINITDTGNYFASANSEGAFQEVGLKLKAIDTKFNDYKKNWVGTQMEYDAISSKDANTLYFIKR